MKIFITGVAGFIGYHTAKRLLKEGHAVCGVDNFDSYYDITLKQARLKELKELGLEFETAEISDRSIFNIMTGMNPTAVIHLAAQAGVRHAFDNPRAYLCSNLIGFFEVLEWMRHHTHVPFIYASSSSVYGNTNTPCVETAAAIEPESFYAATKRSNELMAYSYHKTFGIQARALRFFTVYGPWGRPDMSYFAFTNDFIKGKPLQVYHQGKALRDYTYVDDIVEGIIKALHDSTSWAIYNLGYGKPHSILELIGTIEQYFGKKAHLEFLEAPKGDVNNTFASTQFAKTSLNFQAKTPLQEGMKHFLDWYTRYYKINF